MVFRKGKFLKENMGSSNHCLQLVYPKFDFFRERSAYHCPVKHYPIPKSGFPCWIVGVVLAFGIQRICYLKLYSDIAIP